MKLRQSTFAKLLMVGLLAGSACDEPVPCTPGRQLSCACGSGRDGVQTCNKDGTYDECRCGGDSYDSDDDFVQPVRDASSSTPSWWPTDGGWSSKPADAGTDARVVLGTCSSRALPYRPLDVEYSAALDRIIAVSTTPNRLLIQDPNSEAKVEVELPLTPSSVSVSPDGKTAAVAHDAYLTVVDLVAGTLTSTISTSFAGGEVVLASNGFAYVFPERAQQGGVHSVELATKTDQRGTQFSLYGESKARLHPGGTAIYSIGTGSSSGSLRCVDISAGKAAETVKSAPYYSDRPMCDDVWFTEAGDRLFTACGTAFRASPSADDDMTYAGALGGASGRFKWIVHSAVRSRVYGIPTTSSYFYPGSQTTAFEERQVRVYTADFLALEKSLDIPCLQTTNGKQEVFGRFVFVSSGGDNLYVVGQLDANVGAAQDWTIATIPL